MNGIKCKKLGNALWWGAREPYVCENYIAKLSSNSYGRGCVPGYRVEVPSD